MLIFLLAYLGGVLAILSPCILPVLPFVFTQVDQPFRRSGLPLLAGMAVTFSVVAIAAAFGGHWIIQLNQGGRYAAMLLFLILGISLLFPSIAVAGARPLVRAGTRMQGIQEVKAGLGRSFVLGISTGLLWAPCAGPILGLVLTGAALQGPSLQSSLLLLCFALGAGTSLGVALLAGKKVFSAMKLSLPLEAWIHRALGATVIVGVVAIAFGWDTKLLTRVAYVNTTGAEERLIGALHPEVPQVHAAGIPRAEPVLDYEGRMPELSGALGWLNSPPLNRDSLRGKVVLINFWTYSCINCLRALPYVRSWAAKYKDAGLVVIGVHTPEFSFEKEQANIEGALRDLKITYPVAIDSNHKIWQAFNNEYWPAFYFIDGKGQIGYHQFGEGQYGESERVIQELLKQNGATNINGNPVSISVSGVEVAPGSGNPGSPETYVGYRLAERFKAHEHLAHDAPRAYSQSARLSLNQWGLSGTWDVGAESAVLQEPNGTIVFRFHSRDLHLVLGPSKDGKPIRFKVKLDGIEPGDDHGSDTSSDGAGEIREYRLYQLIRQKSPVEDRTFEIEFLDPGVQAFSFTFG